MKKIYRLLSLRSLFLIPLLLFINSTHAQNITLKAVLGPIQKVSVQSDQKQSAAVTLAKTLTPSVSLSFCPDNTGLKSHLCLAWLNQDRQIEMAYSSKSISKAKELAASFITMPPAFKEHDKIPETLLGIAATPYKKGFVLAYLTGKDKTGNLPDLNQYDPKRIEDLKNSVENSHLYLAVVTLKEDGNQYKWTISRSSRVDTDESGDLIAGTPSIAVIGDRINLSYSTFSHESGQPVSEIVEVIDVAQIGRNQHISGQRVAQNLHTAPAPQLLNIPENTFNYAAYADPDSKKMKTSLQTKPQVQFNGTAIPEPGIQASWLYHFNQMDMSSAYMVTLLMTDTQGKNLLFSLYPDIFDGKEGWSSVRKLPIGTTAISTSEVVFSGEQPAIIIPGLNLKDFTLSLQAFSITEEESP
ncbi:hypothetical protein [Endozoicomonas arenosclerae]|uniref:hypothetical protein n=1 Tax=Endozoicomonas arenosclerae TaxID=1633495 RepID=UPI0007851B35|nr:hypothetical protein [Endozoicomonas arenosclerae]